MKSKHLKISFGLFWALCMIFVMSPASFAETVSSPELSSYTFMVYLNGTDLESEDQGDGTVAGAGSNDLDEMMAIGSEPGVLNVVVQTGGTKQWRNTSISPETNQRWYIKNNEMELIEDVGQVNMAEPETLKDFIIWTATEYPAEKYVLALWNHGGGAHGGYAHDELFEDKSTLSLADIRTALEQASGQSGIAFELIGFDACLMATIETAYIVSPFTKYFIGSEETEPGHGWNYTPIFQKILDDPTISGDKLGEAIAQGFREQALEWDTADETTLSVINAKKIGPVIEALEALVSKAGTDIDEPAAYVEFAKGRNKAEDYGNSGGAHGDSTDMVDIGNLAKQLQNQHPEETSNIISALNNAVVFNLTPPEKKPNATGLTVYLPCKDKEGFEDKLTNYKEINFSPVYTEFIEKYGQIVVSDTTGVELEDSNPASTSDQENSTAGSSNILSSAASAYNGEDITLPSKSFSNSNIRVINFNKPVDANTIFINENIYITNDKNGTSTPFLIEKYELTDNNTKLTLTTKDYFEPGETYSIYIKKDISSKEIKSTDGKTLKDNYKMVFTIISEDRFEIKIKESDISKVNMIYSVLGQYYDNNTKIRFLGMDNDVDFDETTGIVRDNFDGTWVQLGGQFVSLFLMDENDGKYSYSVPIKLNGQDMDLQIIYDTNTETTSILGAWKGIDPDTGLSDRNIIKLKAGDIITPMFYSYDLVTDKDEDIPGEPFTVQDPTKLELQGDYLPQGEYLYGFYIEDIAQNDTCSEFVDISLLD
ncbi:clostripain-related cysteine peptidase [Desulfoscipio gibsoniae]|uniref:Clostripain family protease n=1 Tax=Desulfoscipio gibsoniae DSM 7213 TaxID=767817 RepID=R4KVN3_9FIRM|nr:clostripain-related cysteine peptidase [Desulfoscipio gibsoniae]AGL03686.1 clostripain family protease [Desulfoscipio gibsoniae DSM 7213]